MNQVSCKGKVHTHTVPYTLTRDFVLCVLRSNTQKVRVLRSNKKKLKDS